MMAAKVKMCDECKHFVCNGDKACSFGDDGKLEGIGNVCAIGHKPRFHMPRNNDPYDPAWGYKRKCDDFESVEHGGKND